MTDAITVVVWLAGSAFTLLAAVGVVAIVNLAIGPRTFRPSLLGKSATAVFILTSVVMLYFKYQRETSVLIDVGIWTSLALTLLSSADYFFRVRRLVNER